MKGFVCLAVGHDYETKWEVAFSPALGEAEVQKKQCQRCGYKVPTGLDRPVV